MAPRRRPRRKPKNLKKGEQRNWLELPRDVISTILLKLGAVEILESAQKVCTLWREICKDPVMWRSVDMRNSGELHEMPYDLEKMARHAIDRSCGQLVDINIEYFGNDDLLKYIVDRSKQLRRLRFVCCCGSITCEGLTEAAKDLPLLEELELTFCDASGRGLEAIGSSCPRLKTLKWNQQACFPPESDEEDDLEENLSFGKWEPDGEALAIGKYMHGLHHLQIIGNSLTNVGLKAILDGCPHLESLDLRRCFNLNLKESIGKTCAAQIKDLLRPEDSTKSFEFSGMFDDDESSCFHSDCHYDPYDFDMDDYGVMYDDFTLIHDDLDDDFYGFFGGGGISALEYARFFD